MRVSSKAPKDKLQAFPLLANDAANAEPTQSWRPKPITNPWRPSLTTESDEQN